MSAVEQQLALLVDQCNALDLHAIQFCTDEIRQIAGEVPQRWQMGRKSMRTMVMYSAMAATYPCEVLPLSLSLDATINLLDDILDDILSRRERGHRILELLRVMGWFNAQQLPPHLQQRVAVYFTQCIGIVLGENVYVDQMKTLSSMDDLVATTRHCYDAKSLDVDIFAELPLFAAFGHASDGLVSLARYYRALFLMNKDLHDRVRDMENQTETPILLMVQRAPERLQPFLRALADTYMQSAARVSLPDDPLQRQVAAALREMIQGEYACMTAHNMADTDVVPMVQKVVVAYS